MTSAAHETRSLVWELRLAGWTTLELREELGVTAQDLARMLLGELEGTGPQRNRMRALLAAAHFPLLSHRERAGP